MSGSERLLVISADDYGYSRRYDAGIVAAAEAGAVDAVSVMVGRDEVEPDALRGSGVELGLHLELVGERDSARAGPDARAAAAAAIEAQIVRFRELLGSDPAFIDGHRHAHARPGYGVVLSDAANAISAVVRSVDRRHRSLLRCRGVATPDLLVGRGSEDQSPLPSELEDPASLPAVTEWMVHPGYPDPGAGSAYDAGREEDLQLLLGWKVPAGVRRTTHRRALAG